MIAMLVTDCFPPLYLPFNPLRKRNGRFGPKSKPLLMTDGWEVAMERGSERKECLYVNESLK